MEQQTLESLILAGYKTITTYCEERGILTTSWLAKYCRENKVFIEENGKRVAAHKIGKTWLIPPGYETTARNSIRGKKTQKKATG